MKFAMFFLRYVYFWNTPGDKWIYASKVDISPDFGYYPLFSLPALIAVFLSVSSLMEYLILFHKHIELYRPQSYK